MEACPGECSVTGHRPVNMVGKEVGMYVYVCVCVCVCVYACERVCVCERLLVLIWKEG